MDSDKYPCAEGCALCHGTGMMSWQQPSADCTVLRTIEVDCPNGCGHSWRHPAAERDKVVETPDDRPARIKGQASEANKLGADFIVNALQNRETRPAPPPKHNEP